MKDQIYRSQEKVLECLGIQREFKSKRNNYPFNWDIDRFKFQWASVLIPRGDIEKIVWNKCKDEPLNELQSEINMAIQVPFLRDGEHFGIIHINVSLDFRYDKSFKYGEVTKSLPETCLFILENSTRLNDFFLLSDEVACEFLNYYVLNSQYGLGRITSSSAPVIELSNN